MTSRAALVCSLVLLLVACDDSPLEPFEIGVYRLAEVNDAPLPAVIDSSVTDTTWIVEGLLVFAPDSTFEAQFTFHHSSLGDRDTLETELEGWWGSAPGNLIWVQFPGDVILPPPDTLDRETGALILERGDLTLRFEQE